MCYFLKFIWNNELGEAPVSPILTLPKLGDEHYADVLAWMYMTRSIALWL